ncbi:MAG: RNA methyltransferase [Lentisphaeria bacterium]|nr:RNA methyltransferase [Lentisphaeria bacterium]
MTESLLITSLQNPRVKHVVKLRDRRPREQAGQFIIEGYRGILRACQQGCPVLELYICPELFKGDNEDALIARCVAAGARLIHVPPHVFGKMAYRDKPEGLLAVAPQKRLAVADLPVPGKAGLFIIAEGIEKPGNLGTMLRSADATGVDAILLCDKRTDLFNPNVVRASTGALFSVPVAEDEPAVIADWLEAAGCAILAATPHAEKRYDQIDLTGPVALAMGAEQYGLTDFWLERATVRARIPMLGMADSLNVATATTILLYETLRQRLAAGMCVDPGRVDH